MGRGITMELKKRSFSKEFKLHVLREIDSGRGVAQVAREYRLHPDMVSRWRTQYDTYKDNAFAGSGHCYTDEARMAGLERKVVQLEAENELLKKALSQLDLIRGSGQDNGGSG